MLHVHRSSWSFYIKLPTNYVKMYLHYTCYMYMQVSICISYMYMYSTCACILKHMYMYSVSCHTSARLALGCG